MKWTKKQQQAIGLRDKNILVSAAAGSGKTAVLVERIKRLIIEENCPIDRMLIVTFTNAAASEMKEKIRKAISKEAAVWAEKEEGQQQAAFLKRQLGLLPSANISTFHSFALEVIRRYFYLTDIEPDFRICDSIQETLLRGEAMDQLLEELFEEGSREFFEFLRKYSGDRDEKNFRDLINSCYDTIRSLPEPFEWLREMTQTLKDGQAVEKGSILENIFRTAEEKISQGESYLAQNEKIAEQENLDGLRQLCQSDRQQLMMLKEAAESSDYDAMRKAIASVTFARMNSRIFSSAADSEKVKSRVTTNRNGVKDLVKSLKNELFSLPLSELKDEISKTYESALYLEKLVRRYDSLYRDKKASKNVADFGDIEHYAYEILKDNEAAAFYREKFRHIFIDEYQDSNVIQEALISLIKRPDNLFMVGDVKQSIYKFRLAEPEIFQRKYMSYASGEDPHSCKIDLNMNFRSKRPVIDFINGIFEKTMEGYDENARLYAGDLSADMEKSKPNLILTQVPWSEDADIDEELKNIMKAEKEAYAAAAIIRDSLGEIIYDSKAGCERPLEKRDIVILMRGIKNYGDIFHKILTENDIPAYIDDNDGFFDTMEINTLLAALYIVDNPKQDVNLITLLRSEMMNFTIGELISIRIGSKKGSYYDAFKNYADAGQDEELAIKCRQAAQKITIWQKMSGMMPLDRFIWRLMLDTGFYTAMGAMPSGSQRQANLRALVDKAGKYQSSPGGTLYGFIRYIEAVKEKKVTMGQVKMMGEKDDLVRIMTVHKSKGLEFPMVILTGYCRSLKYDGAGRAPVFHKDIGIGFPIVDPEKRWHKTTLLQRMIRDRFRKEGSEEEKRILYVALTRAMDRLLLLGICNDAEKELDKVMTSGPADSSYFAMTGKIISSMGAVKIMDDSAIGRLSAGRRHSAERVLKVMESCADMEVSPRVREMMSFTYPYADDLKTRSKYSVSALNDKGKFGSRITSGPEFSRGEKPVTSSDRGTAYHAVLEHMDIAMARQRGRRYIEELVRHMTEEEMLTEKEAAIIDAGKLEAFAMSDIASRMAKSGRVEKERRFNFIKDTGSGSTVIRGIIDCFFEEDGEFVLLDYKTGNTGESDENVREKYSTQMELYSQALKAAYGKNVKEAYLYLTDAGKIIKM